MLKDKIFTYLQQYKSKKNLFKNLLIQLLISKSTIKKLSIIHLLFFIPMLHAETKHCYFLDRLNCENCPAPLMFKCGNEIKFVSSTAPIKTIQVAERRSNGGFYTYQLPSPSVKAGAGNLVNKAGNLVTNTQLWARQKMKAPVNNQEIEISYYIDEDDLNVNPEEEGFLSWLAFWKEQDKTEFCWYNSVPQIIDAENCRKKFCLADIKCRKNDDILTHKNIICKAIGTDYDKCPQAINCKRREAMNIGKPIGYFDDEGLNMEDGDLYSKNNFETDYAQNRYKGKKHPTAEEAASLYDEPTVPSNELATSTYFYYTSPPQRAVFKSGFCNLQLCIADILSTRREQAKAVCSSRYDKRCPRTGQGCVEEKNSNINLWDAKNRRDLIGISLLSEVETDSDRNTEIKEGTDTEDREGGPKHEDNTTTSGSSGSVQ